MNTILKILDEENPTVAISNVVMASITAQIAFAAIMVSKAPTAVAIATTKMVQAKHWHDPINVESIIGQISEVIRELTPPVQILETPS